MKRIEGTAMIDFSTLDDLRESEQMLMDIRRKVIGLAADVDTEQYDEMMKKINNTKNVSDEEFEKRCKEAAGTLKIRVSERCLRNLIKEYINDDKSEARYTISEMTKEEFAKVPLILESGQRVIRDGSRKEIEEKKKIIKERDAEIIGLRKQLADIKVSMSYMVNPNAIGDRHEMGG